MPEESINIYMSLVDKVSGPLSGIFRGVRAYSTGYAPNPQRDRWKREDRRSRDQNERKKAAPKGGGNQASSSGSISRLELVRVYTTLSTMTLDVTRNLAERLSLLIT